MSEQQRLSKVGRAKLETVTETHSAGSATELAIGGTWNQSGSRATERAGRGIPNGGSETEKHDPQSEKSRGPLGLSAKQAVEYLKLHVSDEPDADATILAAVGFAGTGPNGNLLVGTIISRGDIVLIRRSILNGWNTLPEKWAKIVRDLLATLRCEYPRQAKSAFSTLKFAVDLERIPAAVDQFESDGDEPTIEENGNPVSSEELASMAGVPIE